MYNNKSWGDNMIILNEIKNEDILEFNYDFEKEIKKVPDILKVKSANIAAKVNFNIEEVIIEFSLDAKLTLACAKTLKPVQYNLNVSDDIVFSNSEDADYPLTNTINLKEIAFGYIMSEKPYTVYHEDAAEIEFVEKDEKISPFLELEGMLDK